MLEKLLNELGDKISAGYSLRIDEAENKSVVDDLENRAIERLNTIYCVIQWAQAYEVDGATKLAAADALATGVSELLEWLEDDEYTSESKLEPIRVLLREYRETDNA